MPRHRRKGPIFLGVTLSVMSSLPFAIPQTAKSPATADDPYTLDVAVDEVSLTFHAADFQGIPMDDLRPRYGVGVAGRVAEGGRPIVVPTVRHEPMALLEFSQPTSWREARFSLVSLS